MLKSCFQTIIKVIHPPKSLRLLSFSHSCKVIRQGNNYSYSLTQHPHTVHTAYKHVTAMNSPLSFALQLCIVIVCRLVFMLGLFPFSQCYILTADNTDVVNKFYFYIKHIFVSNTLRSLSCIRLFSTFLLLREK